MTYSKSPHPGDTCGVAIPPREGEGWEPAARAQASYLPLMGRSARMALKQQSDSANSNARRVG
jgi:hypothetical protein